jgi:hypothetical protein
MAKIICFKTRQVLADLSTETDEQVARRVLTDMVIAQPQDKDKIYSNHPSAKLEAWLESQGTCACFSGYVCSKHRDAV